MQKARLINNAVADIAADQADVEARFHASLWDQFIDCPDDVAHGSRYADGSWSPPPPSAPE